MRMRPLADNTLTEELEKTLQLEILKHEKYKELYQLIKLERTNRSRIDTLMSELGLERIKGYEFSPLSPLEVLTRDMEKIKEKSDGAKESSTQTGRTLNKRPTLTM